jgi:hypothetical protein
MTAFVAANLTKYNAGGSGDNIIADGYIKSVEKVWIDSFAFTSVITSADTIDIASIPPNKKITGVEVYFPAITPTSATITVGTLDDTDKFIDSATVNVPLDESATQTDLNVIRMDNEDGMAFVTTSTTNTTIQLAFDTIAITAPTAGTITTIVRYT